jgi:hypothetical protein
VKPHRLTGGPALHHGGCVHRTLAALPGRGCDGAQLHSPTEAHNFTETLAPGSIWQARFTAPARCEGGSKAASSCQGRSMHWRHPTGPLHRRRPQEVGCAACTGGADHHQQVVPWGPCIRQTDIRQTQVLALFGDD